MPEIRRTPDVAEGSVAESLPPGCSVVPKSYIRWVEAPDGTIALLDLHDGARAILNGTGAWLWKIIAEGATVGACFDRLAERYRVDVESERESVEGFVHSLVGAGLVHLRPEKIPIVTIVIPALNCAENLRRCLQSVTELDFPKDDLEVIVVDNNSTDETAAVVRAFPDVMYEFAGRRNRSVARNTGGRIARGAVIAFLDADCMVETDWLQLLIEPFADPRVGACQAEILAFGRTERSEPGVVLKFLNLPVLQTGGCAVRRSAIEEIGFFDEDLESVEDVDLGFRILRAGHAIVGVRGARVRTTSWTRGNAVARRAGEQAIGLSQFGRKWRSAGFYPWWWFMLLHGAALATLPRQLFSADRHRVRGLFLYHVNSLYRLIRDIPAWIRVAPASGEGSAAFVPNRALDGAVNGETLDTFCLSRCACCVIDGHDVYLIHRDMRQVFHGGRVACTVVRALLGGAQTVRGITDIVAARYEADRTIVVEDVARFLADLSRHGFLEQGRAV